MPFDMFNHLKSLMTGQIRLHDQLQGKVNQESEASDSPILLCDFLCSNHDRYLRHL
jgi:hypothetical protein